MSEQLTITIKDELAKAIDEAVADGAFETRNEVVEEALVAWRRMRHEAKVAALRAAIDEGEADVAAGRVRAFNLEEILAAGRERFQSR